MCEVSLWHMVSQQVIFHSHLSTIYPVTTDKTTVRILAGISHIFAVFLKCKYLEASNRTRAAEVSPALEQLSWHAKDECKH